jgi:hypothetical protein
MTTIPAFCGDEFIGLEKSPMVSHKFGVGNRVRLTLDRYAESSPWDIHTISRKLPAEANVCQYRVKRVGDGQERTVSEHQMVAVGAEDRGTRTQAPEPSHDPQRVRDADKRPRGFAQRSDRGRR